MSRRVVFFLFLVLCLALGAVVSGQSLGPPDPAEARIRMPGTQPGQLTVAITDATTCRSCHEDDDAAKPVPMWRGSMMSQAAKDPLFWAALTVAAQDSIWLEGSAEGADICLRCHMPAGWLGGRSEPTNGSAMIGADFDGVTCEFCHRMVDPFFQDTYDRNRECLAPGCDWDTYWDEATALSESAAMSTKSSDEMVASHITYFDGDPFYGMDHRPLSADYTESASGQYFVADTTDRRASFADAGGMGGPPHSVLYSRYHKSRYFCATCHDVSNPFLANRGHETDDPLPTESESAFAYAHAERTFSEFMLSDFGVDGGAPGTGAFAPSLFTTSRAGNLIASCQDCHMPDVSGRACVITSSSIYRPDDSVEHPTSGAPSHDLTGANVWMSEILASTKPLSANYDPTNETLLDQGPSVLTLDLEAGIDVGHEELLAGAQRALINLQQAATIEGLTWDEETETVRFRVVNHTGHKLISGYPEGRRMWVNIRLYDGGKLVHEVNPYDDIEDTLRGLPQRPGGPFLGAGQSYEDSLVYEAQLASSLTGEAHSQHFLLSDSRVKDNRIPPRGFRVAEAAARLAEPVWMGLSDPNYFTSAEYAGGYDEVELVLPEGGVNTTRVEVRLFYQTTSREYIEFLRDEINGTGTLTLTDPPPGGGATSYIVQSDPFFDQLEAWGNTIWNLWSHNRDDPGAAPILMVESAWEGLFADGFESGDTTAW